MCPGRTISHTTVFWFTAMTHQSNVHVSDPVWKLPSMKKARKRKEKKKEKKEEEKSKHAKTAKNGHKERNRQKKRPNKQK